MSAIIAGKVAPQFELPGIDGKTYSLAAALREGPVLAAFFKVSCPTSQFTFPFLERIYENYGGGKMKLWAVSQDDARDTREFCREFEITFPVLMDAEGYPASNAYALTNVPSIFLIAQDGKVQVSCVGFSAPIWKLSPRQPRRPQANPRSRSSHPAKSFPITNPVEAPKIRFRANLWPCKLCPASAAPCIVEPFPATERRGEIHMRATDFEFRYRFWIICAIFWLGFQLSWFDHSHVYSRLARWMAGVPRGADYPLRYAQIAIGLGAVVCVLASLVRTWAGAYLHSSIIHDINFHSDHLVADGPYRHLRNPLYLGTVLLAAGLGVLASPLGFVFLVAAMFLFTLRLILREEANLAATQGESYREYLSRVPRLLPSFRARVPASGAKPDWRDSFTGEIFMWGCAAGITALALTRSDRWFWTFLGAGFLVLALQSIFQRRRMATLI